MHNNSYTQYNYNIYNNVNSRAEFKSISVAEKRLLFALAYLWDQEKTDKLSSYTILYSDISSVFAEYGIRLKDGIDIKEVCESINNKQTGYILSVNDKGALEIKASDPVAEMCVVNLHDIYEAKNNSILYVYLEACKGKRSIPAGRLSSRVQPESYNNYLRKTTAVSKVEQQGDKLKLYYVDAGPNHYVHIPVRVLFTKVGVGVPLPYYFKTAEQERLYLLLWDMALESMSNTSPLCLNLQNYREHYGAITVEEYNKLVLSTANWNNEPMIPFELIRIDMDEVTSAAEIWFKQTPLSRQMADTEYVSRVNLIEIQKLKDKRSRILYLYLQAYTETVELDVDRLVILLNTDRKHLTRAIKKSVDDNNAIMPACEVITENKKNNKKYESVIFKRSIKGEKRWQS